MTNQDGTLYGLAIPSLFPVSTVGLPRDNRPMISLDEEFARWFLKVVLIDMKGF